MRGDQLIRQWRLLSMLLNRRTGATVAEMSAELNVKPRTVYRDLEVLQDVGIPMVKERTGAEVAWKLMEGHHFSIGVTFGLDEVVALRIAGRVLGAHGGEPWAEPLKRALGKVASAVPGRLLERLEEHLEVVATTDRAAHDYASRQVQLAEITRALEERRPLDLTYATPGRPKPTSRRVHPLRLYIHDRGLYLVAHDLRTQELRTFLLDRVRLAQAAEGRFELPEGFDPESYFADAFAVFRGGPVVEIEAEADESVAHLIEERRWHPTLRTRREDGLLRFTLKVHDNPELRAWLRSFGPAVRVLAPASLAAGLAEEARQVYEAHSKRAVRAHRAGAAPRRERG